jgi:hypothetical protein
MMKPKITIVVDVAKVILAIAVLLGLLARL